MGDKQFMGKHIHRQRQQLVHSITVAVVVIDVYGDGGTEEK